jgi:hypothetical protein
LNKGSFTAGPLRSTFSEPGTRHDGGTDPFAAAFRNHIGDAIGGNRYEREIDLSGREFTRVLNAGRAKHFVIFRIDGEDPPRKASLSEYRQCAAGVLHWVR